jgi:hypothetical protein
MAHRAVEIACAVTWLACGACGRIAFDRLPDGTTSGGDAAAADAAPSRIVYAGPFVQRPGGTGPTESFQARAFAAGDAIVIQATCGGAAIPTGASITAPGWDFKLLGSITASQSSNERSAAFGAIAPDTLPTTISVAWTGSSCNSSKNDIGDEFAMIDPAGGAMTFDSAMTIQGTGDCTASVTIPHDGDAVWAACDSADSVRSVGPGLVKGADDGIGDWTAYRITSDPAGTTEPVQFTNPNVGYVLSIVTLKPR